jgi:hypothetical protein
MSHFWSFCFGRRAHLIAACLLATAVLGCGGSRNGRVTGKVSRPGGEALAGASVIARADATGITSRGTTDVNGTFELSTKEAGDGTPPGAYKVSVAEARGGFDTISKPTIAPKYASPDESGLSFELGDGETKTFDITVEGL